MPSPAWRNTATAGLFLDLGMLTPKHAAVLEQVHTPADEVVVEWRALTVALLDVLAERLRQQLGCTATELPLVKILEGGTWRAGREIASACVPMAAHRCPLPVMARCFNRAIICAAERGASPAGGSGRSPMWRVRCMHICGTSSCDASIVRILGEWVANSSQSLRVLDRNRRRAEVTSSATRSTSPPLRLVFCPHDVARVVVVEDAHELAEVDVRHARVAADDEHVLVVDALRRAC